ncbi:MAG: M14 family metallopeptidase [Deltaproteobacteria bacterium]|nr:M14 family metallopeptidase [Deltaproteobacteria bacterium]
MTVPLASLNLGFRQNFLRYDELTAQLHAWCEAYPTIARLRTLGQSVEGRELWLLELGEEPDRARPSVWVDANMHATELSGSSVALAIAEDFIRLHVDPASVSESLPHALRERLRGLRVFVLPRVCPDGAEAVLTTGQYVRSNVRDRRPHFHRPHWVPQDLDGDGLALLMRRLDPSGEFVESGDVAGLMLPRTLEDTGPFYKVFPEGLIEDWDGETVPDPYFLGDNDTDLNRNFPWHWEPEPGQEGAGRYPTSEPESRAIVAFVTEHPTIFAWLNLHTFGGVYIRPHGMLDDNKMNPSDLALFRQVAEWGEQHGGYPTVSGFAEFTYVPDKPLHGALADYAYHQRGAVSLVCELWDLFAQLGFARRKPFVEHYTHLSRDEMQALGRWDRTHNHSRIVRPWVAVHHPQLGPVEVGGVDSRVGMSNPPLEQLPLVCERQSAFFARLAATAPSVELDTPKITSIAPGLRQIEVTVRNTGYLPTYILDSSRPLPWNEPLVAELLGHEGCTLVDSRTAKQPVGHLEGWGRGLYSGAFALFFQRSSGSVSEKTLRWIVQGEGPVTVRVASCRVGESSRHIAL